MCQSRASSAVLTEQTPEAAGAETRAQSCNFFLFLFFSLGKLEETGILKFADKSEKKKNRKVIQQVGDCLPPSLTHTHTMAHPRQTGRAA